MMNKNNKANANATAGMAKGMAAKAGGMAKTAGANAQATAGKAKAAANRAAAPGQVKKLAGVKGPATGRGAAMNATAKTAPRGRKF